MTREVASSPRGPRHTTTVRHMASSPRFCLLSLFFSFFTLLSSLLLSLFRLFSPSLSVPFYTRASSLVFSIGPRVSFAAASRNYYQYSWADVTWHARPMRAGQPRGVSWNYADQAPPTSNELHVRVPLPPALARTPDSFFFFLFLRLFLWVNFFFVFSLGFALLEFQTGTGDGGAIFF